MNFMTSPIVGMMIQSDELIFFRGVGIPAISIHVYLFVYLSIYLSACLSVYLSIYLSISTYLILLSFIQALELANIKLQCLFHWRS